MKRILCMIFAIVFAIGTLGGSAMAEVESIAPTEAPFTSEPSADTPHDSADITAVPTAEPGAVSDVPTEDPVEATEVPDEDATTVPTEATEVPEEEVTASPTEATEVPEEDATVSPTEAPEDNDGYSVDDVTGGNYTTMAEGDWRVVMGADLTAEQKAQVYSIFGLTEEGVADKLLSVTNEEERFYFEGKIPSSEIGTRSISCIYIKALKQGSGLDIKTYNIDYCTDDMYRNALITVGITDASIVVAAPVSVSGTAALTGVYKAYESMTGSLLNEYAKLAGIDELIATGELAAMIGSEEATAIINELKKILDVTQTMTDDEVKAKIREIAADNDVTLTDNQIQQILTLARTLEGLDVEQLRERALGLVNAANGWQKFTNTISDVVEDIGNFFKDIAQFFKELFEKWFS